MHHPKALHNYINVQSMPMDIWMPEMRILWSQEQTQFDGSAQCRAKAGSTEWYI